MSETSPYVVSFDWLQDRLGSELKIIDASWYLPAQGRNAKEEFQSAHVPGAVYFDQDACIDPQSTLPHALPSPEEFAAYVGGLGISQNDVIVVYDGMGMFSGPRVWWMLRTMGARDTFVLDGGFDEWLADKRPTEAGDPAPKPVSFRPSFDPNMVASFNDMKRIVDIKDRQILDARGAGRFSGSEPEPREGMRSGHMPGAKNVPVFSLSHGGKLKNIKDLQELFESKSVNLNTPIVTTCGSGVTAAVISLALQSLGAEDVQLYDGSWSEWGSKSTTKVVTGEE